MQMQEQEAEKTSPKRNHWAKDGKRILSPLQKRNRNVIKILLVFLFILVVVCISFFEGSGGLPIWVWVTDLITWQTGIVLLFLIGIGAGVFLSSIIKHN